MLRLDLISSSLPVSLLLLFYFASVSVLTLYWVVVFSRSTPDANGINVWYAAVLSGTLVLFGVLSDWLRVRKPFMLVGAAASIVMTFVLIVQTGHPQTGYYSNVLVVVLLGTAICVRLCPLDGQLHRAGRIAQPGTHGDRTGRLGLDPAHRCGPVVPRPSLGHHHLHHAGGQSGGGGHAAGHPGRRRPTHPRATACASRRAPASVIAGLRHDRQAGPQTLANRHRGLRPVPQSAAGGEQPPVGSRIHRCRDCWPTIRWPSPSRRASR